MRGRPPTIREEAILDAARDVFRELGHTATTAGIAQRAGVSEGILFYRYKTKEALLAAVILRETEPPERLRELVKEAGRRSLKSNLEILVETVLDATLRAHPLLELALTSPSSSVIQQVLFTAKKPPPEQMIELLGAFLQAEMRIGRVRELDPVPFARALFGGCLDFAHSRRLPSAAGDRASFVRGLVDLLIRGVRSSDPDDK
jgi:AcrR family transcriptional regulator